MTPADRLLERLDAVRATGVGRWMARCPAHDDRRPSLSVRELDDGRVLIHDFGGCSAADVVAAMGLTLADLYPANDRTRYAAPLRQRLPASDALHAIAHEATVICLAAEDLVHGRPLGEEGHDRLVQAARRIHDALEVTCAV